MSQFKTEQIENPDEVSQSNPALTPYTKKWVRRLLYLSFLNFIIAGTLALFMRTDQAGDPTALGPLGTQQVFGQLLTAHGLGMFVGWQFPFAYGLCVYIFPKYMGRKIYNERLLPLIFWLFTIGFYLVWLSTLLGFGPGWYFLFPLPFHGGPAGSAPWGAIQALIFFAGMMITNASLFVFAYNTLGTAFSNRYGDQYDRSPGKLTSLSAKFAASIGFDAYMPGAVRDRIVAYPAAAIAAVVTTLDMIVSAPPFLTLLADGAVISSGNPAFLNNLVAKNFLWINYHPIVYFAFFPLIGMYYILLPVFAKRNFTSSRWARAPWPLLLITGVGVYSHHLFMDTSQPFALQFMSQNMSMLIGIASAISIFTLLALMWRSNFEWTLTAKWLAASIVGWIVGGYMGVEQGNIALDVYEHNTYLIVSHFHFNGLDGIVFAAIGVLYWILPEIAGKQWYSRTLAELHFWGSVIGGFGLASTFALLGFMGVPRREFAPIQPNLPFTAIYQDPLLVAFFFAIVVAAAQIPFIWNILKTLMSPTIKPVAPEISRRPMIQVPMPTTRMSGSLDGENPSVGTIAGNSSANQSPIPGFAVDNYAAGASTLGSYSDFSNPESDGTSKSNARS